MDIDYIESLPDEILFNVLVDLDLTDLLRLCQTSKRVYAICQDDFLWYRRTIKEFPWEINSKQQDETWERLYMYAYNNQEIPVYRTGKLLGKVKIQNNDPTSTFGKLEPYLDDASQIVYGGDNNTVMYVYQYINGRILPSIQQDRFRLIRLNNNDIPIRYINITYNSLQGLALYLLTQDDNIRIYGYIDNGTLNILDYTNLNDMVQVPKPKICRNILTRDIIGYIITLRNGINVEELQNMNKNMLCQMLKSILSEDERLYTFNMNII